MKKLKNVRAITYRRYGIPALILEGKWLTTRYRLSIGDVVDIDYQPKEIRFRKNPALSKERKQMLQEKKEIRRKRLYGLTERNDHTITDESAGTGSIESGQG